MEPPLQEGIYYDRTRRAGDSLSITFLKISDGSTANEVSAALSELWLMYRNLRDGKVSDSNEDEKQSQSGNLTMLIGYGPDIFSLNDIRTIPADFDRYKRFNHPSPSGGGYILDGSRVKYSSDIRANPIASDHVMLQFIGDNEFVTRRAVVELWKLLSTLRNSRNEYTMFISGIYTGFQRNDNRSWLGFHDGISNLATKDRLDAIAIKVNQLKPEDMWIAKGTYLGFMRIEINFDEWEKIDREAQEFIIGRDKTTGCPIIDIDKYERPIKDGHCPIMGNTIIQKGNETIRGAYPVLRQQYLSQRNSVPNKLQYSHVARAKVLTHTKDGSAPQYRIFRQGFDYFEPVNYFPGFRIGLNFVSFQNTPSTLFTILKEGFSRDNIETNFKPLEDYFFVRAAGVFLIPPVSNDELFPGDILFRDRSKPQHYRLTGNRSY